MTDPLNNSNLLRDLRIGQLMTRHVSCTPPDTDFAQVIRLMRDRRFSCIVVVEKKTPVGIITERDLVRFLADAFDHSDLGSKRAAEVMSFPPVTIQEDNTLYDALAITRAHRIRHLPVVDRHGEIAGLMTQSDITKAYFSLFDSLRDAIEKSLDERTKELLEANERLKALSLEDPLLNVGNRRAMEVDLDHTHASARRYQRPYSVILFDVDFFKQYNDHYGHLAGDQVLKAVANKLSTSIRKADRLYRYGGEEFLLLCPETPLEGCVVLASRLVDAVRTIDMAHCRSPHQIVTISAGAANVTDQTSWSDVVHEADRALYAAKAAGRNRASTAASRHP